MSQSLVEVRAFSYQAKSNEGGGYLTFNCVKCGERNKRAVKSGEVFERVPQQVLSGPHQRVEKGSSFSCYKCGLRHDVYGPLGRMMGVING